MATKIADAATDTGAARRMQAEQTARETAADAQHAERSRPKPQAVARADAAAGQKLIRSIGPGNLNPGARIACIKASTAIYCGRMSGIAYSVMRAPNKKDPTKESICFAGRFLCILANGDVVQSLECYVPSVVQRAFAGMLESGASQAVRFALEIWAEPDEAGKTPSALGFTYTAHDLMKPQARDELLELAAESGLIEPMVFQPALAAPSGYDPDTGEIHTPGV